MTPDTWRRPQAVWRRPFLRRLPKMVVQTCPVTRMSPRMTQKKPQCLAQERGDTEAFLLGTSRCFRKPRVRPVEGVIASSFSFISVLKMMKKNNKKKISRESFRICGGDHSDKNCSSPEAHCCMCESCHNSDSDICPVRTRKVEIMRLLGTSRRPRDKQWSAVKVESRS